MGPYSNLINMIQNKSIWLGAEFRSIYTSVTESNTWIHSIAIIDMLFFNALQVMKWPRREANLVAVIVCKHLFCL
jgi:hypothetical protein